MSLRVAGPMTCFGCGGKFSLDTDHNTSACVLAHPAEASRRTAEWFRRRESLVASEIALDVVAACDHTTDCDTACRECIERRVAHLVTHVFHEARDARAGA